MKSVKHSLQFITELDENEPTAKRLLSLPKEKQTLILEGLLKEIIVPKIKPVLNEVNKNNSWALLRVAE